jgi:single-stranded DNA-specific DHH superfamily exonuclease
MEKASAVEKLKALDEERSKLLDEAKAEALEMAHRAVETLTGLGVSLSAIGRA